MLKELDKWGSRGRTLNQSAMWEEKRGLSHLVLSKQSDNPRPEDFVAKKQGEQQMCHPNLHWPLFGPPALSTGCESREGTPVQHFSGKESSVSMWTLQA